MALVSFEQVNKMTTAIVRGAKRVGTIDYIEDRHVVSIPILPDFIEGRFSDPKWARKYALDCLGSAEGERANGDDR